MADAIEQALSDFIRALSAGVSPNPREFIERVPEADRRELEALIELAIVEGPRRAWDAEAFAASPAAAASERIYAALPEPAVAPLWPGVLVRWRNAARIKRADLVKQLAETLGVGEKAKKVEGYYHELETGELEPTWVSSRVWDALAELLGIQAEDITDAARDWSLSADEAPASPAFARAAEAPAGIAASERVREVPAPEARDEVDELFLGPS